MERQGKIFDITDAAIDLLTEKGYSQTYGARFLKRHIDQQIKLPITNQWKTAARFSVDAENEEIVIKPMDAYSLN
jgi:ATP-dependent Clp protease ATP-binding subunit ClpA